MKDRGRSGRSGRRAVLVASCGVLALGAAARGSGPATGVAPDSVTWSDHIAPVVARECVTCHNPDGSAPFSLTTYDDARTRADRIAKATSGGVMPPWLPASEPGTFAGQRVLTPLEVELFARWAREGMLVGDAGVRPRPDPERGWQPGAPDLVVTLPSYRVPAEGRDVYRNLVVPIPVDETRWVEYVELRPGSRSVVHHARMMVDRTSSSRDLSGTDGEAGFDGMDLLSGATNPDGHFIGWTPGKTRLPPLEGMPWRLDPGTDLVVQLHFRASGVEEEVTAEVEFHFADRPPTREPAIVVVSSLMIDIPAGAAAYTVSNSFTLPVPVEVLSVYPHSHYLGKDLEAYAVLPNGREVPLIHIPEWDFNWQDDYRFAEPVSLPAGATIIKEFTFDNSAQNPNNPSDPPRRVVYGSNSDDEMADLILQVLPRNAADREELLTAQAWQHESEDMAYMAQSEFTQGSAMMDSGDLDAATRHFQESLQYRADHIGSLVGLSRVFTLRGDAQSALLIARQGVMMSNSESAEALDALGAAYALAGQLDEAIAAQEVALRLARGSGQAVLADSIDARLRRYRSGGRR